MDARLHHLQREAEFVSTQGTALALLEEFHGEKLASMIQHMSHARLVGQYDANNTYQYVVNREDVQLSWLAKAITDLGGAEPGPVATPSETIVSGPPSAHALFEQDARAAQAMVERWRPRVEAMTNARHRKMLAGHPRRDRRAAAFLRAGDGGPHRPAGPARRHRRARRRAPCCESDGLSNRVAVALGSNLGDRRAHLDFAVSRLESFLTHLRVSRYHDTDPVGVPDRQPLFLNAAAVGETALSAREVLDALLAIERERGRERPFPGAARTLDLDLVLYGNLVMDEPGLIVPHPRFRERLFVLEPLAEVAPEMVDPVTGLLVRELFDNAKRKR